jgi:hypothetical protein
MEALSFRTYVREVALGANKVLWSIIFCASEATLRILQPGFDHKNQGGNRDVRENPT